MPYYPKNQIKTDLYTKGGKLQVISTKKNYIGYYWKTSKGEFFSNKNPNIGGSLELEIIPLIPSPKVNKIVFTEGNTTYNTLKKVNISNSFLIPSYYKPIPTFKDYEIGNLVRFFAKKLNENLYIEVSKDVYNKLKNKNKSYNYSSYLIFEVVWAITGKSSKVSQTNLTTTQFIEQNLNIQGLGEYLKFNYLEFYK